MKIEEKKNRQHLKVYKSPTKIEDFHMFLILNYFINVGIVCIQQMSPRDKRKKEQKIYQKQNNIIIKIV